MDVEQLFPEVAPLRKETVRLHPRVGEPTCRDSSVGGPLLWPAAEAWPLCFEHEDSPMVPVVQIYRTSVPGTVPFPEGCDLLQVLWCPRKHSGHRWIVPHVQWRKAGSVGKALKTPPCPADLWENYVPRPCVVHPELVTEYPYWDLHDDMWDALEFRFLDLARRRAGTTRATSPPPPGRNWLDTPAGAKTQSGRNASNVGIEWNTC